MKSRNKLLFVVSLAAVAGTAGAVFHNDILTSYENYRVSYVTRKTKEMCIQKEAYAEAFDKRYHRECLKRYVFDDLETLQAALETSGLRNSSETVIVSARVEGLERNYSANSNLIVCTISWDNPRWDRCGPENMAPRPTNGFTIEDNPAWLLYKICSEAAYLGAIVLTDVQLVNKYTTFHETISDEMVVFTYCGNILRSYKPVSKDITQHRVYVALSKVPDNELKRMQTYLHQYDPTSCFGSAYCQLPQWAFVGIP
jgi:hypothetical protein